VAGRLNIRLFPVGYWLWPAGRAGRATGMRGLPFPRRRAGTGADGGGSAAGTGGREMTGGADSPGPDGPGGQPG